MLFNEKRKMPVLTHCTPTCDGCLNEVGKEEFLSNVLLFQPFSATSPGKYLPFITATSTGDQIDKFLPSVQIKKLFNEGKLLSSE